MYPVNVFAGLIWVVVYALCLRACVESVGYNNEVIDTFSKITQLYLNAMEEIVSKSSPHYNDFFQIFSG